MYIGGGKLCNTLDDVIFTAICLYFTLNHGTKNDSGLLVRRMPVQQIHLGVYLLLLLIL